MVLLGIVPGHCEPELVLQFKWEVTGKSHGLKAQGQVTVNRHGLIRLCPVSMNISV